jgi:hypothetical protein
LPSANSISPVRYSPLDSGLTCTFSRLRDQMSSRNAIEISLLAFCSTCHSSTAPMRNDATNGTRCVCRNAVTNPHSTSSTVGQNRISNILIELRRSAAKSRRTTPKTRLRRAARLSGGRVRAVIREPP